MGQAVPILAALGRPAPVLRWHRQPAVIPVTGTMARTLRCRRKVANRTQPVASKRKSLGGFFVG